MSKYMFIDTVITTRVTIVEADNKKEAIDNFEEGKNIFSTTETENVIEDIKEIE